jgi:hypothetical protein
MPQEPALTVAEQKLNDVWSEHLRAEFSAHSADETVATMTANPGINEVPVMIGGNGREEVYEFCAKYFLPQIPPDIEIVPVSRTIGQGTLVDEIVLRFTHTIRMDWMLPGIPPSGKRSKLRWWSSCSLTATDGARAPELGPGVSPGAAGASGCGRSAGCRGRGRTIAARSEHSPQCADSPVCIKTANPS